MSLTTKSNIEGTRATSHQRKLIESVIDDIRDGRKAHGGQRLGDAKIKFEYIGDDKRSLMTGNTVFVRAQEGGTQITESILDIDRKAASPSGYYIKKSSYYQTQPGKIAIKLKYPPWRLTLSEDTILPPDLYLANWADDSPDSGLSSPDAPGGEEPEQISAQTSNSEELTRENAKDDEKSETSKKEKLSRLPNAEKGVRENKALELLSGSGAHTRDEIMKHLGLSGEQEERRVQEMMVELKNIWERHPDYVKGNRLVQGPEHTTWTLTVGSSGAEQPSAAAIPESAKEGSSGSGYSIRSILRAVRAAVANEIKSATAAFAADPFGPEIAERLSFSSGALKTWRESKGKILPDDSDFTQ